MKKLAHLKKINIGALKLVSVSNDLLCAVTPQLLEEVIENIRNDFQTSAASRFCELAGRHQHLYPGRPLPVIHSLEELDTRHEEIMTAYADRLTDLQLGPLPKPPIEGTETIIPLQTGSDLRDEGLAQHNCVGGHVGRVRAETCYVYRILEPERATLSIIKAPGGEWQIDELFIACNKPVKSETRQAVTEWLSQTQLGI